MRRIVQEDAAAEVRGDIVGDDVVDDVHLVGEWPQQRNTAAVVVRQVGLDQIGFDADVPRAEAQLVGRLIARNLDAAAGIKRIVVVDAVVMDVAAVAQAEMRDAAAIFARSVAANVVVGDLVVVGAVEDADRAGEAHAAVAGHAIVQDADAIVVVVGRIPKFIGRPADRDRAAVGTLVAVDDVVGDLNVRPVGMDIDAAAGKAARGRDAKAVDLRLEARICTECPRLCDHCDRRSLTHVGDATEATERAAGKLCMPRIPDVLVEGEEAPVDHAAFDVGGRVLTWRH